MVKNEDLTQKLHNYDEKALREQSPFLTHGLSFQLGCVSSTRRMVDAYYMWPFWLLVLFLLRCVCGWYYAAFISAVLFGSVEVLKAPKASHSVWAQLTRGVTKIGHRACALNAPENTIAGKF